ncbi:YhbY family RNA-binding protein [Methanosphaera sp. ISO3-F5]|uniref:YhbY family RNA-binding protein n=1 Tax=Methanosphaera sp. ISO3-F5 TaxID=1452353 RepID=UPI002B25B6D0|nr:YhbY family RNA-binding protein [Methanosphaera sp. ISO3-F5]WQH65286.1 YhbY family RNA-binding protein [Methanosphaera sp. ISO3-F5]
MRNSLNAVEINIGKNGINENVIEEIKRQLKNGEIVKIRFSRTIASNKDEFLEEIVSATKSKLIDVRGNVAVLYKRK